MRSERSCCRPDDCRPWSPASRFTVLPDVLGHDPSALGGTLTGLIVGHLTFGIPFVVRAILAGHARFDYALEEAALNLGATPLQTFWRVTVPVLRPSIVAGGIFAFVMSLDDVPIALFMGGGDATTLPVRIFTTVEFDFGGDVMAVSAVIVGASVFADAGARPTHRPRIAVRREAVIWDRRRNV